MRQHIEVPSGFEPIVDVMDRAFIDDEGQNVTDAMNSLSETIRVSMKQLGNNDAASPLGAIENLANEIKEGSSAIASAILELSNAIRKRLTRRPFSEGPPVAAEIAEGRAYLAYRDNPCSETDTAYRRAWFALTGGLPIVTPVHCEACGLHRSYRGPKDPCRGCGNVKEQKWP